jgi:hypothetical protein
MSAVTVDFGDGTSATAVGACAAEFDVDHAYATSGEFTATVTSATSCDADGTLDITNSVASVHVFPSAPAAAASWPTCTTFQLRLAGPWTGAGLGNVATLITLRNVSHRGCTLTGYPKVLLIAPGGAFLPTHQTDAVNGAYMFPGIAPHRVALAPGDFASFMIGYGDNPGGTDVYKPYEVACPPSVAVRVILPGTHQYGTASVGIGPCEVWVDVSPLVPGPSGLRYQ